MESEALRAFGSTCIVEVVEGGVDAQAFHWSAMNFERHRRRYYYSRRYYDGMH